jgi:hypothetical protein
MIRDGLEKIFLAHEKIRAKEIVKPTNKPEWS